MQPAERSTLQGLSQHRSVQRTKNTSLAMVQNVFALLMGQSGASQASFFSCPRQLRCLSYYWMHYFFKLVLTSSMLDGENPSEKSLLSRLGTESRHKLKHHVRIIQRMNFFPSSCSLEALVFCAKHLNSHGIRCWGPSVLKNFCLLSYKSTLFLLQRIKDGTTVSSFALNDTYSLIPLFQRCPKLTKMFRLQSAFRNCCY